jgi:3-hydroxybutyryl-CoA dehydratase
MAAQLRFEDILPGDCHSFEKIVTTETIADFARWTGDFNPLHMDLAFGKKSPFGGNIAHGMLAGCFFSTLIGMYCPGERSLYLSQTLNFRSPVFAGDHLLVRGTVVSKNESVRLVTLKTEILKQGVVVIDGEAKVRVSDDK